MNNWMQKRFPKYIVMSYYLVENQFIHMPKMMHFPVWVTFLKISSFPKWSCVLHCCSECPGVFFKCRNEWWGWFVSSIDLISSLQKYNLLFFAQIPIAWALKNSSFVHEYKMLRNERLQHGKFLYWNYSAFWIFVRNNILQKLKIFIFICHMFTSLKNHFAGKQHNMFVSRHISYDC